MGTITDDRRVQRTQQLLRSALVSLIEQKGFETLTVQDIIDRANVGRATFYAQLAKSLFTSTIRHPVVRIARSPSLSSFMRERQKPILILRKTQDVRRG